MEYKLKIPSKWQSFLHTFPALLQYKPHITFSRVCCSTQLRKWGSANRRKEGQNI